MSVILNSAYDYDPASRKEELVEVAATVLEIVVPAFRPDIAVMLGAFPLCESITFLVICSVKP